MSVPEGVDLLVSRLEIVAVEPLTMKGSRYLESAGDDAPLVTGGIWLLPIEPLGMLEFRTGLTGKQTPRAAGRAFFVVNEEEEHPVDMVWQAASYGLRLAIDRSAGDVAGEAVLGVAPEQEPPPPGSIMLGSYGGRLRRD